MIIARIERASSSQSALAEKCVFALVVGLLALVLGLDVAVYRIGNRISSQLNESRMVVTEKVLGFVLAAIAVELALADLASAGATHPIGH